MKLWKLIIFDENLYVRKLSNNEAISDTLEECVRQELNTLQEISKITSYDMKKGIS